MVSNMTYSPTCSIHGNGMLHAMLHAPCSNPIGNEPINQLLFHWHGWSERAIKECALFMTILSYLKGSFGMMD